MLAFWKPSLPRQRKVRVVRQKTTKKKSDPGGFHRCGGFGEAVSHETYESVVEKKAPLLLHSKTHRCGHHREREREKTRVSRATRPILLTQRRRRKKTLSSSRTYFRQHHPAPVKGSRSKVVVSPFFFWTSKREREREMWREKNSQFSYYIIP